MIEYLYFNNQKTVFIAGDVIRWNPDNEEYTFYRGTERLHIGKTFSDTYNSPLKPLELLFIIALATGLKPVQSDEFVEWTLQ